MSDRHIDGVFVPSCNEIVVLDIPASGDGWLGLFISQPTSYASTADTSVLDSAANVLAAYDPDADFVDLANDVDPVNLARVARSAGAHILDKLPVLTANHYKACNTPIISF